MSACPESGENRKRPAHGQSDAIDPQRTFYLLHSGKACGTAFNTLHAVSHGERLRARWRLAVADAYQPYRIGLLI